MHTWGDGGKNEGIDNDTRPLRYESPYITRWVKWEIATRDEIEAATQNVVIRTTSGAAPREPFEHSRRPAQA